MYHVAGAMIAIHGLTRRYEAGNASFTLKIEAFTLSAGAALAIAGPSGCGKSTLLGLLALAIRPTAYDEFIYDGVDIKALWKASADDMLAELRGKLIGFAPQTGGLLPYMTLRENIILVQRIAKRRDAHYIDDLARQLEILPYLDRLPSQLSVGQRQRAVVLRALCHRPRLLIADEPTSAVHPNQADTVLSLLRDAARSAGAALVLSTHDTARARTAGLKVVECAYYPVESTTTFSFSAGGQCG